MLCEYSCTETCPTLSLSTPLCVQLHRDISYLVHVHRSADPVAGPLVDYLQPLVDGRLEPVVVAGQG